MATVRSAVCHRRSAVVQAAAGWDLYLDPIWVRYTSISLFMTIGAVICCLLYRAYLISRRLQELISQTDPGARKTPRGCPAPRLLGARAPAVRLQFGILTDAFNTC